MKRTGKKVLSLYLAFLIILSMIAPAFIVSYGAVNSINITDENGTYDVVIIANNGHSLAQSITVENIDKEAPTVNSISIAHKENGGFARFLNKLTFKKFFNEKVEITIDASDKGVSGIDRIEYRLLMKTQILLMIIGKHIMKQTSRPRILNLKDLLKHVQLIWRQMNQIFCVQMVM